MADPAAQNVHHRLDEGKFLEKFAMRNGFDLTWFLQRLDKDQRDEEPQKCRGEKENG